MGDSLHYDYPVDRGLAQQKMGLYRHIVDYMAHKKLGGNTLIYIIDAIWSGRNWDATVEKWQMAPFSNDWTSSLFISQDAVAIESVGFDFLYYEYKNYPSAHGNANYPLVTGVQDYIHQAADPANWPAGISYDPSTSNHSSPVGSLGVHEHWNNSISKQYSRNLGTGNGIELVGVPSSLVGYSTAITETSLADARTLSISPNPVKDFARLKYSLKRSADVRIELISIDGRLVVQSGNIHQSEGTNVFLLDVSKYNLSEGTYFCRVIANGKSSEFFKSKITIKK
jgi:hypothetical protein